MNRVVILISANAEWRAVKEILSPPKVQASPFGEFFRPDHDQELIYFHGGWGKISAAASTQYVIDKFHPLAIVNLGTCGGIAGLIKRGEILLVNKVIVYDIQELMGNGEAAIEHYTTEIDMEWLSPGRSMDPAGWSSSLSVGALVSADRDLLPTDVSNLVEKYNAVAADWESGAIAWVAQKNAIRCIILRGVTDLVGRSGGEAYGNITLFHKNTRQVISRLIMLEPEIMRSIRCSTE